MKRTAFGLVSLILSSAALAQEPPSVDLVAKFLVGAEDGAAIVVEYINADLTQSGPGAFGAPTTDGDISLTVTEIEACVFDLTFILGAGQTIVRFDANRLAGVDYALGVTLEELPIPMSDYVLTFTGGSRLFVSPESIGVDGQPQENPNQQVYIMTSVPQAEMEAALTAFRTDHCPGLPA